MSEEQLKAFIAKVQADTSLQEQLKAEGADPVSIAKAAGFSITTELTDYISFQIELEAVAQTPSDLSDDELEAVTGGGSPGWPAGMPQGLIFQAVNELSNLFGKKYSRNQIEKTMQARERGDYSSYPGKFPH